MPQPKLTPGQEQALVADYETWVADRSPGRESAASMAARHGISKSTMYRIIEQHPPVEPVGLDSTAHDDIAGRALIMVFEAGARIHQLEAALKAAGVEIPEWLRP